jgi:hypothetical protein
MPAPIVPGGYSTPASQYAQLSALCRVARDRERNIMRTLRLMLAPSLFWASPQPQEISTPEKFFSFHLGKFGPIAWKLPSSDGFPYLSGVP